MFSLHCPEHMVPGWNVHSVVLIPTLSYVPSILQVFFFSHNHIFLFCVPLLSMRPIFVATGLKLYIGAFGGSSLGTKLKAMTDPPPESSSYQQLSEN